MLLNAEIRLPIYSPFSAENANILKPINPTRNIKYVRSKGENSADFFRLKILKTAAEITAKRRSKMPNRVVLFPSLDNTLTAPTPIRETAEQIICKRVGFSFKKAVDKNITATGTREIISPERADEVKEIP